MGYTTDFEGAFQFSERLTMLQLETLTQLNRERHGGNIDVHDGMPGIWCGWTPTDDGMALEWDGVEKFYNYIQWLQFVIDHYVKPWGLKLNGEVTWHGEDRDDRGLLRVTDNIVTIHRGRIVYD